MIPGLSLGTPVLRHKFRWLLVTYINVEDHNEVKLLLKPSVKKLLVFYPFLNSVQVHAKLDKKILMGLLENRRFGKSLVSYVINLFLEFLRFFPNKVF